MTVKLAGLVVPHIATFDMQEPGLVRFLGLPAAAAVIDQVEVLGLHVMPDITLHLRTVITVRAGKAKSWT